MLLRGNFTFRGLGGIDKVEDEYSHNKGAEGVEQYIAEAHRWRGRLTHRRRALGLFPVAEARFTPAKDAGRGGGSLTMF